MHGQRMSSLLLLLAGKLSSSPQSLGIANGGDANHKEQKNGWCHDGTEVKSKTDQSLRGASDFASEANFVRSASGIGIMPLSAR